MEVEELSNLLKLEDYMLTEWIKKRNRRKKIKYIVNDNVKVGKFVGTSGEELKYYIDCRPLITNSSTRINLIKGIYDILPNIVGRGSNLIFAGPQTVGAILAADLALFRSSNSIVINLSKNEVIFPYALDMSGKKIILVDDVITTGNTLKKCLDLLEGYDIIKIVSIVNRGNIDYIENIEVISILRERDINWRRS